MAAAVVPRAAASSVGNGADCDLWGDGVFTKSQRTGKLRLPDVWAPTILADKILAFGGNLLEILARFSQTGIILIDSRKRDVHLDATPNGFYPEIHCDGFGPPNSTFNQKTVPGPCVRRLQSSVSACSAQPFPFRVEFRESARTGRWEVS